MRAFTKGLLAWILSICLFLLAGFVAVLVTIGSPSYIKTTLYQTGFYKNIVSASLNLASTSTTGDINQGVAKVTINEITPVVQQALTPAFLQTSLESIIDGSATWLKGGSTAPTFAIKTADVKAQLVSGLTQYLQTRVSNLPICPPGTLYANFDPLSATCRPNIAVSKIDTSIAAADFVNQLPLLDQNEISLISIDSNNSFVSSKPATVAPKIYQYSLMTPYVIAAIIVACGIAIVVLSTKKYLAVKTIGHTFLWAGALLVVTGAATILLTGKFNSGFIGSANAGQIAFVRTIFDPIINTLSDSFADISLYIGVAYTLISVLCYVVAHKLRLQKQKVDNASPKDKKVYRSAFPA